jgi:hypothetical protein
MQPAIGTSGKNVRPKEKPTKKDVAWGNLLRRNSLNMQREAPKR